MWDAKCSFLPKFKWEKMLITSIADERGEGCHEECCQSFNNFQWYWRYFVFPSTSVFFCHLLAVSSNSLCSAQCNSFNLAPAEMCSHNNDVLFQSIFLCSWPERLSRFHSVSANNNNKKSRLQNCLQLICSARLSWLWGRGSPWLDLLHGLRCAVGRPHQPHALDLGGAGGPVGWCCAELGDVAVASAPHPPPLWERGQATSVGSAAV